MDTVLLDEAAVFYAGDKSYDIIWNTTVPGAAYVECGGKKYHDAVCGSVRTTDTLHKVKVPREVLDKNKSYTIAFCECYDRKPYFPAHSDEVFKKEYKFRPVSDDKDGLSWYFIADTHSCDEEPIKAANIIGKDYDFLVLGGDIPDHSGNFDCIRTIFKICAGVTHGEIPVLNARGNHDTRGESSAEFTKYVGTDNGSVYFTLHIGRMFCIMLDCGEDKPDNHPEYGVTAAFEPYREAETEFIEKILSDGEYKNYEYTAVFCHERIDAGNHAVFTDVYSKWLGLLNRIKPDFMLCGHEHCCRFFPAGRKFFDTEIEIDFPTVVSCQCRGNKRTDNADKPKGYTGAYFRLADKILGCTFNDDNGVIEGDLSLEL